MTPHSADEEAWTIYGQQQLDRGYSPPVPERIDWGFWPGVGPGAEIIGDIRGKRVLDIGSGPGHHAVHLARTYGALVDGVDLSPTQHRRALNDHGTEPGVRFLCADVAEHLRRTQRSYEAAYALRTFGCVDPLHLLPALCDGLVRGAPLVFSALHTDADGQGPSSEPVVRQGYVRLRDQEPIAVRMWVLSPVLWEELLAAHGFDVEVSELLAAPDADNPVVVQLVRARRR
ncbi:SAM-dependent methyltransferase [Streptomyces camelliae]|uniref:Methyltransferase domain-containing protein n=1 Tax=Streptomyces camelliae TaxID=3004093 RepID=A0ABY7P162_9ACTN|nr:class I SAM-dependent methyltransferase [Streptomyces sp. HUAS 2-6]WBO62013.1 methyltransferase domain-containing protein [Streptomyces sp. HUAS 2-6]